MSPYPSTDIEITGKDGIEPVPWPAFPLPTGTRPQVRVSDFLELLEGTDNQAPQELPAIPVAVSGRLNTSGQEDVYRLKVTEGEFVFVAIDEKGRTREIRE